MAASTAEIANLALSHLGSGAVVIVTLATDTTAEGKALNAHYTRARREVLKARAWSFAQVTVALTLVETFTEATADFPYSYRLPEDCVQPQRIIIAGVRTPRASSKRPFQLNRDADSTAYDAAVTYAIHKYVSTGGTWYRALRETINDPPASSASDWVAIAAAPPMLISCDLLDAVLEYTQDVTETREFPPDFENALAARLAMYAAPRIVKDAGEKRQEMAQLYAFLINEARANDIDSQQRDEDPASDFEAARW